MVYVLSYNEMNDEERALALSVQGIINRNEKCVFIDVDRYVDYLKDGDRHYVDVYTLVEKFKHIFDGFVSYNLSCDDVAINMAATVSAAYDILGVPYGLKNRLIDIGLKELADLAEVKGTPSERQKTVFDYCFDRLNKDGLIHQVVEPNNFHLRLRDLAIYKRRACIYTDESAEGKAFRKYVLSKLDKNIPVYGWNVDEIAFIKDISSFGDYALPSDWSCNHSYFSQEDISVKQSRTEHPVAKNKHYAALVVSDGDNIQWLERDFAMKNGAFGQRSRSASRYKMTWTLSPSLIKLCPRVAEDIYSGAREDYFIAGVSGIGYANLLEYPTEHLDEFTEKTYKAMQKSDLKVVCMLDNVANTQNVSLVQTVLSKYSRFENIDGGVWELDPDRYGSGKGKIFWSDGKPFVSVRFTMWHPSCDMGQVTAEWLENLAEELNAMPADPTSERGYSIVNVHPWTMNQQSIDYFVSKLNVDKIELVYADELIGLVKKNVKCN